MFENDKPFKLDFKYTTLRKIAVIGDLPAPQTSPDLSYTFAMSAAEVALLTAAPKFLTDFGKYCGMSDTQAQWSGKILNAGLIVYMADSYVEKGLSLGAAIGVKILFHYLNFSDAIAETAGNTAAIGIAKKNITSPWGIAKTRGFFGRRLYCW